MCCVSLNKRKKDECRGGLLGTFCRDKYRGRIKDAEKKFTQAKAKKKDLDESEIKMITPEQIRRIFERINDEDCELIGIDPRYSRPEWLIITVLPIPPPNMRPSVQADNGKSSEDDLTHSLNDIIKHNLNLQTEV